MYSLSDNKEKRDQKPVKNGNAEDAAFLMKNASSVITVPILEWLQSSTCAEMSRKLKKKI